MKRKSTQRPKINPKMNDIRKAGLNWRFRKVIEYYGGLELFCGHFFFRESVISECLEREDAAPLFVACDVGEELISTGKGFAAEFLRPDIMWINSRPTTKNSCEVKNYYKNIYPHRSYVYADNWRSTFGGLPGRDKKWLNDWLTWDIGDPIPRKWG